MHHGGSLGMFRGKEIKVEFDSRQARHARSLYGEFCGPAFLKAESLSVDFRLTEGGTTNAPL